MLKVVCEEVSCSAVEEVVGICSEVVEEVVEEDVVEEDVEEVVEEVAGRVCGMKTGVEVGLGESTFVSSYTNQMPVPKIAIYR